MDTHEHAQHILSAILAGVAAGGTVPTADHIDGYVTAAFLAAEAFEREARKRERAGMNII